jgi:AraC family transcriptional regulator
MKHSLLIGLLGLIAAPALGAELGGCISIYGADPVPTSIGFALSEPRLEQRGALLLAGLEEPVSGPTADMQIDVLWTRFEQRNQWIINEESDVRTGVCFGGGEAGFDYFAGQVLSGPAENLPDAFSTIDLPASTYAVFTLTGQATDVSAAHALIYQVKLVEAGLVAADAPDLLVFPPGFSPAQRNARIELWVPVSP